MVYVKERDYDYIMGKYHDPQKPFNSFSRFIRRDDIFAAETGLSGEEILQGILRIIAPLL